MLITIKILNGVEHNLEVQPEQSISEIKNLISDKINVPVDQQRVMYKGKPLNDQSKLHDYSIVDGTKIHLIVKKDNESSLTKELKAIGKGYVTDVDQFAAVFNQELKKLVDELSIDDIERYDEVRLKSLSDRVKPSSL